MTFKWIRRGNTYFASSWAAIRFQPILYLFMFGAAVRLRHKGTEPAVFEMVLRRDVYDTWLALAIFSPMVALAAWVMIEKRSGRWRFLGMWMRLAADIGAVTVMLSYHAVSAFSQRQAGETQIFARYMIGAILIFVCALMIRDIWTLIVTERLAGEIHRGDRQ